MKPSTVIWTVDFIQGLSDRQRAWFTGVLQSIRHCDVAADYDVVFRGVGLRPYIMVEHPVVRDAAEIALYCLSRTQLMGSNWNITWPDVRNVESRQGNQPETMKGFTGWVNADSGKVFMDDIHSIRFSIRIGV